MKKKISILAALLLLGMLFTACGENGLIDPSSTETAQVSFNVTVASQTRALVNIGTLVTSGTIRLARGAMVRYVNLTIAGSYASAVVPNLLVGNWHADVQLYDADGLIIYSGSADFTIYNGASTQVIELALVRHQGTALFGFELPTETTETDPDLILWNTMGSITEITNSIVGVNLALHGSPTFVAGKFGNAILFDDYHKDAAFTLPENVMSRGTIELWIAPQFDSDGNGITEPAPTFFQTAPWNEFPNNHCMELVYQNNPSSSDYGKMAFNIYRPGTTQGKTQAITERLTFAADVWMHVAVAWDNSGIGGSSDRMRIYINGIMAASTTETFHESEKTYFEIGNNLYYRSAHSKIDNLKVYNRAKTSFDIGNQ